jgi:hypothetical protein
VAVIKVEKFAGIAPRYSARLLPNSGAVRADNAKLLSGELRGLRETQLLHDFNPSTVTRAYRLPVSVNSPNPINAGDTWIGFSVPDVDFVRTPVVGDSFERYYWTSDTTAYSGAPQYNTRARIQASLPSYKLGIPTPSNTPTVTPPGGSTITRAYLYTFISAYGEEGPPSLPFTATGGSGTWVISNIDAAPTNPSNYNISKVRIYRTITGNTSTEYYWVNDINIGTTTYNDAADDATVGLNFTIPSITWLPPPASLKGIISHPGGFLVGFTGRDLYISQPYQPHAWPVQYIQTCQTEIVGIAIYNNVIVICTTSHPYYAEGMSPLAITLQKLDSIDPCVSRRSIATTINGVYYSSPQGIIMVDGAHPPQLVTKDLFTREEWQNQFSPTQVYASSYGTQYIAFDTTSAGFIFSPAEELAPLTTLDRFSNVTALQQDKYTGDVFMITGNQVRLWDPPSSTPYTYTWTSKEFQLKKPESMGAFSLKYNIGTTNISISLLGDYTTFNAGRILKPLSCVNLEAINGVRTETVTGYVGPQIKQPVGGSPLFNISQYSTVGAAVQANVFSRDFNGNWVQTFSYTITDEKPYRMPAYFKSDLWQIQLIGNADVYSVSIAGTGKELGEA